MLTPLAPGATPSPDSVLFESRGAVLVLGDDAGVVRAVEEVAKNQRVTVFAPGIDEVRLSGRVTAVGTRVAALQGRLGAFRAQVRGPDGLRDIGAASPHRDGLFDLVLDLSRKPLMTMEVAPLGYFAPGEDEAARAEAVRSLQGLVGSFTKPRYFRYQAELCAHSASGLTGCTRCLEVCSAAAISSASGQIRVDPHLCQGCASCTLACPTGALGFHAPARDTLRQEMVDALHARALPNTVLVVHGSAQAAAVTVAIGQFDACPLTVDPLPAFGDELWLDAFALGASAVVLVDDGLAQPAARRLIKARVTQVAEMLRALGLSGNRLAVVALAGLGAWLAAHSAGADVHAAVGALPEAIRPLPAAKRLAVLDALARLQTGVSTPSSVTLPQGACFGEVRVERSHCTLCFACVNLCPTGALADHDGPTPQLRFQEDACVQCGLCEYGCPEKAVALYARFRPQRSAGAERRVLAEDSLQPCTACGTPFISRKLLASSLKRLHGHQVLANGGRTRLMMCPSCRQTAMLEV